MAGFLLISLGDNSGAEIAKDLSFKEFKFQHGRIQKLEHVCVCLGEWSVESLQVSIL